MKQVTYTIRIILVCEKLHLINTRFVLVARRNRNDLFFEVKYCLICSKSIMTLYTAFINSLLLDNWRSTVLFNVMKKQP